MPQNLTLDPTTPLTVSIDFTAEQRPYVQQWYNLTKEPSESVQNFIVRKFVREAIEYRASSLIGLEQIAAEGDADVLKSEFVAYRNSIHNEAQSVLVDLLP